MGKICIGTSKKRKSKDVNKYMIKGSIALVIRKMQIKPKSVTHTHPPELFKSKQLAISSVSEEVQQRVLS